MADARSPNWPSRLATNHTGVARGYANALHAVYEVRPITAEMQRLLDDIEAAERLAPTIAAHRALREMSTND